jgi:hypothetical protein
MRPLDHNSHKDSCEWDGDSQTRAPELSQRFDGFQLLWGLLLAILVLVGDLGIASLGLEQEGFLACFSVGLWLAQYLAIWLLLHSYVPDRLLRFLLGGPLSVATSMLVIIGFNIAWTPRVPIEFVAIICLGGLAIYLLAGWLQSQMFRRSDFYWVTRDQVGSGQYSIRSMLGLTAISAGLALGAKWISNTTVYRQGWTGWDLVALGIWFIWTSLAMGLLSFLLLGALRSKSRWFYLPLFGVALLLGPAIFQTLAFAILTSSPEFGFLQRTEYYIWAYAVTLGVVAGVLMVVPLIPKRDEISDGSPPQAITPVSRSVNEGALE